MTQHYFDDSDTLVTKAARCYAHAEKYNLATNDCDKLADRDDVLRQREKAEKFCKDKGLKFKGTIGDQTVCEP